MTTEVSNLLEAIASGDPDASAQLLPLVYDDLRRLAARQMAREAPGQTLDPNSLVHEAYLRLVGDDKETHWRAAITSSRRRPRPCTTFWSRTPAASAD
jgi:hypothetical protein